MPSSEEQSIEVKPMMAIYVLLLEQLKEEQTKLLNALEKAKNNLNGYYPLIEKLDIEEWHGSARTKHHLCININYIPDNQTDDKTIGYYIALGQEDIDIEKNRYKNGEPYYTGNIHRNFWCLQLCKDLKRDQSNIHKPISQLEESVLPKEIKLEDIKCGDINQWIDKEDTFVLLFHNTLTFPFRDDPKFKNTINRSKKFWGASKWKDLWKEDFKIPQLDIRQYDYCAYAAAEFFLKLIACDIKRILRQADNKERDN